jgi:integrase/recombinase XerD
MHHLTRSEVKSLLQAVPDQRQRLMLLVTFNHGLRVSETITLTGASIRDGFVKVQRLKGSLKTIQPYVRSEDPDLCEFDGLTELARTATPRERLFNITRDGVLKLMKRAGKRAGLPEHLCHPHILKHSICHAVIHSAGVENVRQWVGHRSLASTGAYLRVTDQAAAVAVAKAMSNGRGTD